MRQTYISNEGTRLYPRQILGYKWGYKYPKFILKVPLKGKKGAVKRQLLYRKSLYLCGLSLLIKCLVNCNCWGNCHLNLWVVTCTDKTHHLNVKKPCVQLFLKYLRNKHIIDEFYDEDILSLKYSIELQIQKFLGFHPVLFRTREPKNSKSSDLEFFYPLRKQWYIISP